MQRFVPNIGYWGGKLLTDSLKDIKRYRDTSKYVERASDQIGYKKPTQKSKKMPRKTPYAKKRARDKAMMPRTSNKRKRKTSTKKQGKFKKAKRIRTTPSKFAKRHYDDYGEIDRDNCAYFGFQRHGSKSRMWTIIGEAMTKAMLAKIKIYPRAYDEPLTGVTHFDRLQLLYKRVPVPGGNPVTPVSATLSFTAATTYEGLASLVTNSITSFAERTNEQDLVYAWYPTQALWYKSNDPGSRLIIEDLGESVIELYATQNITIKNLTPNDAGTSELDVVGVNPIAGKKYEFDNFRPKIIDTLETNNPALAAFQYVDDVSGVNATLTLPGAANADSLIAHPPVPRQLFTNCKRSSIIYMKAGGIKKEVTKFKMKHKLSYFIERIYYNQYDKGYFGGCTFFALERKTRSVTGNSRVKISFDRELHMSAYCQLKTQKTMLKHYQNTLLTGMSDP